MALRAGLWDPRVVNGGEGVTFLAYLVGPMAAGAGRDAAVPFRQPLPVNGCLIFGILVCAQIVGSHFSHIGVAFGTKGWDVARLGSAFESHGLVHGQGGDRRIPSMAIFASDPCFPMRALHPAFNRVSELSFEPLMATDANICALLPICLGSEAKDEKSKECYEQAIFSYPYHHFAHLFSQSDLLPLATQPLAAFSGFFRNNAPKP